MATPVPTSAISPTHSPQHTTITHEQKYVHIPTPTSSNTPALTAVGSFFPLKGVNSPPHFDNLRPHHHIEDLTPSPPRETGNGSSSSFSPGSKRRVEELLARRTFTNFSLSQNVTQNLSEQVWDRPPHHTTTNINLLQENISTTAPSRAHFENVQPQPLFKLDIPEEIQSQYDKFSLETKTKMLEEALAYLVALYQHIAPHEQKNARPQHLNVTPSFYPTLQQHQQRSSRPSFGELSAQNSSQTNPFILQPTSPSPTRSPTLLRAPKNSISINLHVRHSTPCEHTHSLPSIRTTCVICQQQSLITCFGSDFGPFYLDYQQQLRLDARKEQFLEHTVPQTLPHYPQLHNRASPGSSQQTPPQSPISRSRVTPPGLYDVSPTIDSTEDCDTTLTRLQLRQMKLQQEQKEREEKYRLEQEQLRLELQRKSNLKKMASQRRLLRQQEEERHQAPQPQRQPESIRQRRTRSEPGMLKAETTKKRSRVRKHRDDGDGDGDGDGDDDDDDDDDDGDDEPIRRTTATSRRRRNPDPLVWLDDSGAIQSQPLLGPVTRR